MSTCKDCKHWEHKSYISHGGFVREPGRFGTCRKIKAQYDEDTETTIKNPEEDLGDDDAYTVGRHSYESLLCPGPDFGCNKWEPKA